MRIATSVQTVVHPFVRPRKRIIRRSLVLAVFDASPEPPLESASNDEDVLLPQPRKPPHSPGYLLEPVFVPHGRLQRELMDRIGLLHPADQVADCGDLLAGQVLDQIVAAVDQRGRVYESGGADGGWPRTHSNPFARLAACRLVTG